MLDSIQEGAVPMLYYWFYWLSIVVVFLFAWNENKRISSKSVSRWKTFLFIVFFILFAVTYMIGRDYFQYRYHVFNPPVWIGYSSGQEIIYQYLYVLCYNHYSVFRLIVWGGAILLVALSAKLSRLSVYHVLFFWFFFFCDKSCYARATLGMAVFFLGFVLCLERKHPLNNVLGLVIALLSVLFHRSMLILIALIPITFIRINRKNVIPFSLAFFIVSLIVFSIIGLDGDSLSSFIDEGGIDRLQTYDELIATGEGSWENLSKMGLIMTFISNLFFCFLFIWESRYYLSKKQGVDSLLFNRLYVFVLVIILVAISFLFLYGVNNPFFYRCLYMSHIPLSLCFVNMCKNQTVSNRAYHFSLLYALFLHSILFVDAFV